MRYLILFVLFFAACKTSPQLHQQSLSLIVLTDTLVAYQGNLDKETKIDRIAMNEKDVKAFITKVCGNDSSFKILMKPEAMGNVGGNMESIISWCKDLAVADPKIVPSSPEDKKILGFTGMPQEFWNNLTNPEPLHLNFPKDERASTMIVSDKTYTILLLKNDMAYIYIGKKPEQKILLAKISDDRIRKAVIEGQKKYKADFSVIIKPLKDASYRSTVDVLDIMVTNNILKYVTEEGNNADVAFAEQLQITSN